MNPYHQYQSTNWQYGYTTGTGSQAPGHNNAYATYYPGSSGYAVQAASLATHQKYRHQAPHQNCHHHPPQPPRQDAISPAVRPGSVGDTSATSNLSSWQQIKQEQQQVNATAVPSPALKPFFPTKTFVKASSTPALADETPASESSPGLMNDGQIACMRLHDLTVHNKLVEVYEKISTEVAPGIHGVRLKLGTEVYTGTGSNFKAAKQSAALAALAGTKYPKPQEKKTMKVRPHLITATQELHELATKKGLEAKFVFIEPPNFEFKASMRLWSKEEMRGNYKVQLSINNMEFYGQADLPQQAKHNAAIQVLPMLTRLPDPATAAKAQVIIPAAVRTPNGSDSAIAPPSVDTTVGETTVKNVIMTLNEIAMVQNQCLEWTMVGEDGPPHSRTFTWMLKMGDFETLGAGGSKKIAKTAAAQSMYAKIPMEWKPGQSGNSVGKMKRRKVKLVKRKTTDESGIDGQPGGNKRSKAGSEGLAETKPVYSVIQAANPISALYEYCRKVKSPDPDFECVAENVLETWQKDNHTFKKTEYTLKLQVQGKVYYASANTKKAAKTAVATEAWNLLRVENI